MSESRQQSLWVANEYDPETHHTPLGSDIPARSLIATLDREAALEAEVEELRKVCGLLYETAKLGMRPGADILLRAETALAKEQGE